MKDGDEKTIGPTVKNGKPKKRTAFQMTAGKVSFITLAVFNCKTHFKKNHATPQEIMDAYNWKWANMYGQATLNEVYDILWAGGLFWRIKTTTNSLESGDIVYVEPLYVHKKLVKEYMPKL